MKKLTFILATLCLIYACNSSTEQATNTKKEIKSTIEKYCFLYTWENSPIMIDGEVVQKMIDTTQLHLSIDRNDVVGIYNYIPAEQDAKRGNIKGEVIETGDIKATYNYTQEGQNVSEEITIQLNGNEAIIIDEMGKATLTEVNCVDLVE